MSRSVISGDTRTKADIFPYYIVLVSGIEDGDGDDSLVANFSDVNLPSSDEDAFGEIVRRYSAKIQTLRDAQPKPDVIVIQIPATFENYFHIDGRDLRVAIKAIGAEKLVMTQLLTEESFGYNVPGYDLCDNMWQLSLAIYVKAGGVPWKIRQTDEGTCFIGIAFRIKRGPQGQEILIGLAEVFDEFGESVTIRVVEDVFLSDRGYHLSEKKMSNLLALALEG